MLRGFRGDAPRGHEDPPQLLRAAESVDVVLRFAVDPVRADEVLDVAADRRGDAPRRSVGQDETQNRNRNAARVGIGRNQRIEGLDSDVEWHIPVAQQNLAERVGGVKLALAETRQAVGALPESVFRIERRVQGSFKNLGHGLAAGGLCVQREERMCGDEPF